MVASIISTSTVYINGAKEALNYGLHNMERFLILKKLSKFITFDLLIIVPTSK